MTASNSPPSEADVHSFWLVHFSGSMEQLWKTGSAVLTHSLTYNQMFYFDSIIFSSKCFEKLWLIPRSWFNWGQTVFKAELSLPPWSGSIALPYYIHKLNYFWLTDFSWKQKLFSFLHNQSWNKVGKTGQLPQIDYSIKQQRKVRKKRVKTF